MPVYLITGANRGLGLEFVCQISQNSENIIFATTRPDADREDLPAVSSKTTHILECDTAQLDSIKSFADSAKQNLGDKRVDFLINNAGVNSVPHQSCLSIGPEDLHREIDINVIGPAKINSALLERDLFAQDARIINMTSGLGSMQKSLSIEPRKCATYSISKAGLNMLTVH